MASSLIQDNSILPTQPMGSDICLLLAVQPTLSPGKNTDFLLIATPGEEEHFRFSSLITLAGMVEQLQNKPLHVNGSIS